MIPDFLSLMNKISKLIDKKSNYSLPPLFLFLLFLNFWQTSSVHAQSLSSKIYDRSSGLKDLDPMRILQTRSGAIFVLTQDAFLVFDGTSFTSLGPDQGLSDSQIFSSIALGPDGDTLIAAQSNRLYVARIADRFSFQKLHFREISNPNTQNYASFDSMAPYSSGIIFGTSHGLDYLDVSDPDHPTFSIPPAAVIRANHVFAAPLDFFGDRQTLWVSGQDGRICVFGSRHERCWTEKNGLPKRRWGGFITMGNETVMARTGTLTVLLDPRKDTVALSQLPDSSPATDSYSRSLTIQRLNNGDLMTQSTRGVDILHDGTWRSLVLTDDEESIIPLLFDSNGSLWLGIFGEGIRQFFSYGAVENLNKVNGLSYGIVWTVRRQSNGKLWIGTNGGLDYLNDDNHPIAMFENRTVEMIRTGRADILWLLINSGTVEKLNTRTGARQDISVRSATAIVTTKAGNVWVATENGLYFLQDSDTAPIVPVLRSSADIYITNLYADCHDTLWLTGNGKLWKKSPGGPVEVIVDKWPDINTYTETVTRALDGSLWVGSGTGLYHVFINGPHPRVEKIPNRYLPSPGVVALMIDHRNRLWVGTSDGVAVFQNGVWISADSSSGLAGDDIAQDNLFEDSDGSIWIGTSHGLSHIISPDTLLRRTMFHTMIFDARIGGKPYSGEKLPYGFDNLKVQLGVLDTQASARIRYRYRFNVPGAPWIDLSQNLLTDAEIPYGQHEILFEGHDPLTHVVSPPISMRFDMTPPWWARNGTRLLALATIIVLIWGATRLRTHYLVRQKQILLREVRARTADLERARAALEVQARRDSLTGLMNRGAMQDSLTRLLAADIGVTIALIDIDHFKRINDTYGHLCGDAVLVVLGSRLMNAARKHDIVGRFGGEEYVIAIPKDDAEGLARIRTIISAVTRDPVSHGGHRIVVTVSAGVTNAAAGDTWHDIIGRADKLLYEAKRNGRNQIVSNLV